MEEGSNEELNQLFDKYCNEIVFVINNLQVTLDLDKVVIGNGVSRQPFLLKGIKDKYKEIRAKIEWLALSFEALEMGVCKFGNEANLLGAAYQFMLESEML